MHGHNNYPVPHDYDGEDEMRTAPTQSSAPVEPARPSLPAHGGGSFDYPNHWPADAIMQAPWIGAFDPTVELPAYHDLPDISSPGAPNAHQHGNAQAYNLPERRESHPLQEHQRKLEADRNRKAQ